LWFGDLRLEPHESRRDGPINWRTATRAAGCDAICAGADAAGVQRVGKALVLWRPKPDEGTGF
jgi:hypothetical protein